MSSAFPDGIDQQSVAGHSALALRFPWYPLVILGVILAVALTGVLGGGDNRVSRARGEAGTLTVEAPDRLRNGVFFEMRFTGEAHRALARPTLAIEASYWRELSINTMVPAPAGESYEDGFFLFQYDPLEAGKRISLKVDGQVNPAMFGGTRGAIEWRDGDDVLAATPVRLIVLP